MLPEPPPSALMMQLIWPSPLVVQAIHVAAKLGIADRLAAGAQSVDDLARAAGAHGVSLHRLLRALSSLGVFAEEGDGRFRHTELSETLRSDHPQSVHAWAVMLGTHFAWRSWGELHEAVVTGTSSFARLYGEPFFAYLEKHPEDARVFHAAMTSGSAGRLPAVLAAYDFTAFEHLVDVGGGTGHSCTGSFPPARRRGASSTICRRWCRERQRYRPDRSRRAARSSGEISSNRSKAAPTDTCSAT